MKNILLSLFVLVLFGFSCKTILLRHAVNNMHRHVGAPFPDLQVETLDSGTTTLSSFKGSALYIHLWATWCTPCLGDIPYMNQLDSLSHFYPGIAIVNVCVKSSRADWIKTIRGRGVIGNQYLLTNDSLYKVLEQQFKINETGLPAFFIVDTSLRVQGVQVEPNQKEMVLYVLVQARKGLDVRTSCYQLIRLFKEMKKRENAETRELEDFLRPLGGKSEGL